METKTKKAKQTLTIRVIATLTGKYDILIQAQAYYRDVLTGKQAIENAYVSTYDNINGALIKAEQLARLLNATVENECESEIERNGVFYKTK